MISIVCCSSFFDFGLMASRIFPHALYSVDSREIPFPRQGFSGWVLVQKLVHVHFVFLVFCQYATRKRIVSENESCDTYFKSRCVLKTLLALKIKKSRFKQGSKV